MQNLMTNNGFGPKKEVNTHQQNKNSQHKHPCQSRESNPEPLLPQCDALPLDH